MRPSFPVPESVKKNRCLGYKCEQTTQCALWDGHAWQTYGAATKVVARVCADGTPTIVPIKRVSAA